MLLTIKCFGIICMFAVFPSDEPITTISSIGIFGYTVNVTLAIIVLVALGNVIDGNEVCALVSVILL